MHRPQQGDTYEFGTPCGLAYLQYMESHDQMGSLVRVLDGLFPGRPGNLASIVDTHRFSVFVPVEPAVRANDLSFVGHYEVPARFQHTLTFRRPLGLDAWERGWILEREGREVGVRKKLSDEERELPEYEVWSFGLLVSRVGSSWSWADTYGPAPRPEPGPVDPCYDVGHIAVEDD